MHQKLIVEDMSYNTLSKEIGFSRSAIQNWATKFGFNRGEKWERVLLSHGNEIVRLYTEESKTLNELGAMFDCGDQTVRRVLDELGTPIRTKSDVKQIRDEKWIYRKHSLNEDYFKTWSHEMAYILGFIAADGCIFTNSDFSTGREKRKFVLKINLKESDFEHLEKFKRAFGYSGKVKIYKVGGNTKRAGLNYSSLDINSMTMVNDIKEIGIRERKSLNKEIPLSLPNEYELDYIRGYFDGNGSVGKQYPTNSKKIRTKVCQIRVRVSSGSKVNLEQMQEILIRHGFKSKNVSTGKDGNIYEICYSTKESLRLFDLLYKDESSMRLEWKYEDFKTYVQQRIEDIKNSNGGIKIL